jgi:hypothetical protein
MTSTVTLAERIRSVPKPSKTTSQGQGGQAQAQAQAQKQRLERKPVSEDPNRPRYCLYDYCAHRDVSRVTRRPPLQTPQKDRIFDILGREPVDDLFPRYLLRQVAEPQSESDTQLQNGTTSSVPASEADASADGQSKQTHTGPVFRVGVFDIHRWVSIRAIEAFENKRYRRQEPDYSSKKAWMRAKRRSARKDEAAAIAAATAAHVFVKSPHVQVIVPRNKRFRSEEYETGPDSIEEPAAAKKARRGRPKKTTPLGPRISVSPTPSGVDSDPPTPPSHRYSMVALALDPDAGQDTPADQGSSEENDVEEEWEVDRILKHKDVDGARHYLTAWIGSDETTWLTLEDLVGAEESLMEYLRRLPAEVLLEAEKLMLEVPDIGFDDVGDLDAGDLDAAGFLGSSQKDADKMDVEAEAESRRGGFFGFMRFKDFG